MGRKSLNQIIQNLSLSLTIDLSKDGMKANFYYETVEFYLCHSLKRGDKDDNSSWVFFEAQKLQFIKGCSVRKKATPATAAAVAVTLNIIWKSSSSVTRKNRQMSIKVAQKWFNCVIPLCRNLCMMSAPVDNFLCYWKILPQGKNVVKVFAHSLVKTQQRSKSNINVPTSVTRKNRQMSIKVA